MTADNLTLLKLYLHEPEDGALDDVQLQDLLDAHDGDLDASASAGWKIKAGTVAQWYDVTVDRADTFSRGQVFDHCMKMYELYGSTSGGSIASVRMSTDDTPTEETSEF